MHREWMLHSGAISEHRQHGFSTLGDIGVKGKGGLKISPKSLT